MRFVGLKEKQEQVQFTIRYNLVYSIANSKSTKTAQNVNNSSNMFFYNAMFYISS